MSVPEFLLRYIIGPVLADARNVQQTEVMGVTAVPGYNPYNTVFYVLLTGVLLYSVYRYLDLRDLGLDAETAVYSSPFLLLGGVLRFIEDAGGVSSGLSVFLVTPVIYLLIAGLFIASLRLSPLVAERSSLSQNRALSVLGTFFLVPALAISVPVLVEGFDPLFLLVPAAVASGLWLLYYFVSRGSEIDRKPFHLVVFSQLFGGVASAFAVSQGYSQKQILASVLTDVFGPPGIVILKSLIAVAGVYVLRDAEDDLVEGVSVFVLTAVGLATGLRVALRASAGI